MITKTDTLRPMLHQRGRAEIDFLISMFTGSLPLRSKVNDELRSAVKSLGNLPDDLDEVSVVLAPTIDSSLAYRVKALVEEWHLQNYGEITSRAFEEVLPSIKSDLDALREGPAKLFLDPKFIPPSYWEGVEFHRTEGGWDGHEYAGYIHAEIIHRKLVNAGVGGIFKKRRELAARAPKDTYAKILDMGCSTAHFTQALQEVYPYAKITGVDLSARTLEHAQRVANAHDWDWQLYQRAAEKTGFDTSSFDLVASYILLHEVPLRAIKAIFAEAFRVLKPGGDMIMSDVTRYADVDKLTAWKMDQDAKYGGEPHWRESASANIGDIARDAGFVDVKDGGDPPNHFPFVVQGRKP